MWGVEDAGELRVLVAGWGILHLLEGRGGDSKGRRCWRSWRSWLLGGPPSSMQSLPPKAEVDLVGWTGTGLWNVVGRTRERASRRVLLVCFTRKLWAVTDSGAAETRLANLVALPPAPSFPSRLCTA